MSDAPRAFVAGWPVRHSRSPLIHGFWLRQLGIAGSYEHAEVPPERFAEFVGSLRGEGYVGGNVTIPHKEAAFRLCRPTSTAAALGAVNTLWFDGEDLQGDNTDVQGFLGNLDAQVPGWDRSVRTAIVLGAGGAARAVLYGLRQRGVRECLLLNRTLARAQQVAGSFEGSTVTPAAWEQWPEVARRADLVINTTSLGMAGQPPLSLELAGLRANAIVNDIVYVPLETPLLADARRRGLQAVDGLGMLLHQAVPGFERRFGVRPEVTPELRALIVADIERS